MSVAKKIGVGDMTNIVQVKSDERKEKSASGRKKRKGLPGGADPTPAHAEDPSSNPRNLSSRRGDREKQR